MGDAHGAGTGENAHAWADAIERLVDETIPLEFVWPHEPEPWRRRLIESLGVRIVLDANAPHPHVRPVGARGVGIGGPPMRHDVRWSGAMAAKDWTPEQLDNAMKYAVCRVCGAPREAKLESKDGVTSSLVVCPNGHPSRC